MTRVRSNLEGVSAVAPLTSPYPLHHVTAMRSTTRLLLSALALTAAHTSLASAQLVGRDESVYTWRGTIPSGGQFTIRNFNGPIDVRPASGNTAELRAEKRLRGGGDVRDVGFEIRKSSSGDVEICSTQNEDTCYGDRRNHDGWRRQVTVAMTVLVPRGVRVKISTGNGAVSVEGAGSDVQASTGNGRVRIVETEGQVRVLDRERRRGSAEREGARDTSRPATATWPW